MKKCLNKKRSPLKLMNTCIHSDVGMLQSFLPAIMGFVVILCYLIKAQECHMKLSSHFVNFVYLCRSNGPTGFTIRKCTDLHGLD